MILPVPGAPESSAEIGADAAIGTVERLNLSLEEGHLAGFRSFFMKPAQHPPGFAFPLPHYTPPRKRPHPSPTGLVQLGLGHQL